ncbi:MAG: hypothetical protein IJ648_02935, partial [Lachnospiraceae bacterium]|nr:hypothetical protein [Lachnospiraceae bacterium]
TTFGAAVPTIVNAAEESTETYRVFVAFGGDAAEENDWGLSYAGGDVSGDITVTDGEIKVGDTVTVGLEFAEPVVNVWYVAPTIIAEKVVSADFDVKVLIDGEEVDADLTAGDNWWYEETGDFGKDQAIRVAGGFNEWGTQYISEPSGFKKLEFQITANSIQVGDAAVENATESTETYPLYLAFGGDKAEENDWALSYDGSSASEGVTATDAEIKVGDTAKVKLEFDVPVLNAWYFAPFIVGENIVDADFTVKAYVDGEEVELDMSQGDNWWYEATGSYSDKEAVRIAGGFNEWGAQYMAEPSGFTSLEFEITANKIMIGAEEEKPQSNAGPVDLDGTYHAYIGFQTPKYSFRNSWSGESGYGNGTPEFDQVTGWDSEGNEIVVPGTYKDAEIKGNGTYTVAVNGLEFPDGEFAEQDYMNLIFFSTDIPNTGEVEISDVVLKIDGSEVSDVNALVNPESVNYIDVQLQSIYNDELKTIGYYPTPMTDIEITFTISGFNYDNDGAAVEEDTEANGGEDTTEAPVVESEKSGPNVGLIIGIVCGCLVICGLVVFLIVRAKKK